MYYYPPIEQPPVSPLQPSGVFIAPGQREWIGGLIYLFLHMFLMGELIHVVFSRLGISLSLITLNLIYMSTGVLFLSLFMWKYLANSLRQFRGFGVKGNLIALGIGYGIRFVASMPLGKLLPVFLPDFGTTPNTEVAMGLVIQHFIPTAILAVILAPIAEELMFRGAIFGSLYKKNRILAYTISTLAFAFLHVQAFLFFNFSPSLFLVMLVYVPAGLALAWAYEKSGSIWTAIVLHGLMNLVAVLLGPLLA